MSIVPLLLTTGALTPTNPPGYGAPAGLLLDSLVLEADGLALDFLTATALVRDTATPANAFLGDINDLLTYASPSAKYVMSAAGVLEAGTTLRTDHDAAGNALGLLIEEQRTNLHTWSEDFSNAIYNLVQVTVASNADTAPDGATTADRIVPGVSSAAHFLTTNGIVSVTSGNYYRFSIFVEADGYDRFVFRGNGAELNGGMSVNLAAETASATGTGTDLEVEAYPGGRYRVSFTVQATGTASRGIVFQILDATGAGTFAGDGTSGVLVWGLQVEEIASGQKQSSYIKTEGSQATRAADDISLATSAFAWSATAGAIVARAIPTVAARLGAAVSVNDGSGDEEIRLFRDASGNLAMQVEDGGANQLSPLDSGANAADTTEFVFAGAWAANDFAVAADGGAVQTDGSGTLPSVDTFEIGRDQAGNAFNGHLKSLVYRPRRITNAELVAETD